MFRRIRDIVLGVIVGAFTVGFMVSAGANVLDLQRVSPFKADSLWLLKQARAIVEAYQVDALSNDISEKDMVHGALKGMIGAWDDPYTRFVDPQQLEQEQIDIAGKYGGVGMTITKRDSQIIVVSPIEGSPSDKVGIKPKDYIFKVNDDVVIGWELNDVVQKLRGEPGTEVVVWIRREGEDELLKMDIVREEIKLESVRFEMLSNDVGYLRLSQFKSNSTDDVKRALDSFKDKNARGIIVDLRNNGGGLLNVAVDIASMFLDGGLVVSTKGRVERMDEELFADPGVVTDLPMVVLINEGSASASEILAGALHDRERATLVGTKSFGKGSVQTMFNLSDGSGIYVTIARYYTPSGVVIDHVGLSPDIVVSGDWTTVRSEDVQLQKASEVLLELIK